MKELIEKLEQWIPNGKIELHLTLRRYRAVRRSDMLNREDKLKRILR